MKVRNWKATSARNSVEALSSAIQSLWSTAPVGEPREREMLIAQLTRLECDVERLRIRNVAGAVRPEDVHVLRYSQERFKQLDSRWRPYGIASLRPIGVAS